MCSQQDPKSQVLIGPDIDHTNSALDKKLYRQILFPNGLRVMLIQDTPAMHQLSHDRYSHLHYDDNDNDDDDGSGRAIEEDDEEMEHLNVKGAQDGDLHNHSADDEEDDDDDDEPDGIRKAAAAMVVGCGSFYDPPDVMGLGEKH